MNQLCRCCSLPQLLDAASQQRAHRSSAFAGPNIRIRNRIVAVKMLKIQKWGPKWPGNERPMDDERKRVDQPKRLSDGVGARGVRVVCRYFILYCFGFFHMGLQFGVGILNFQTKNEKTKKG